ncbi:MAG: imidazole glycerol phosphate synthase subunit HisH [Pseudomonadota bacterium]
MSQRIAIIDYGSGNLRSVEKAFERAAHESGLAAMMSVTDDPDEICKADRLLLPGVGAFGACMAGLSARDGVLEAMEHVALVEARPFLGICVGMQLLAEKGLEFGEHQGLGWIPGKVASLSPADPTVRTPHMGWNTVSVSAPHHLMDNLDEEAFYFAHSYHFETENNAHAIGSTVHGEVITAAIARDNIAGVQFHPEKSQHAGITLLKNFLTWDPS